jgi:hypothetical protein
LPGEPVAGIGFRPSPRTAGSLLSGILKLLPGAEDRSQDRLRIVSDGLDFYIEAILRKYGLVVELYSATMISAISAAIWKKTSGTVFEERTDSMSA